jgi:hypothetical protein
MGSVVTQMSKRYTITTTDRETANAAQQAIADGKVSGDSFMSRSLRWHRLLSQITGALVGNFGAGDYRPSQLAAWMTDLDRVQKEMANERAQILEEHQACERASKRAVATATKRASKSAGKASRKVHARGANDAHDAHKAKVR